MASRNEERERLREARLTRQQEDERGARRRLIAGYAVAGVLSVAVIAGVVAVVAASGGGSSSANSGGAFGQHYDGLEARRTAANVTTMATPDSATHFHPQLAVYVNGKRVEVPANIGIPPSAPPTEMAGLHTHDATGTIHDEGMASSRLGQFFAIWGVPFSRDRLGPYRARGSKVVRMWVDGRSSRAFGNLNLADGQQIVVSYGPKSAPPPHGT
ncbi:MAG: hypothetical protein M3R23_07650 [Actinomycetota bacterium]|nr:hypothetical protein [Actinomycetota bacterium]